MKKLVAGIMSFAMAASLVVVPGTASAAATTVFRYENDFSTADAPGSESTDAWDMEGVGKWTTVITATSTDRFNWEHNTELAGPNGNADGVLKLGDSSRASLYFDEPITSGNVHVGFDICFGSSDGMQDSQNCYSWFGFFKSYDGEYDGATDSVTVSKVDNSSSGMSSGMIKSLRTEIPNWNGGKYEFGGLGNDNLPVKKNIALNNWERIDVVYENIHDKDNMAVKWYMNGELVLESDVTWKKVLQPFYSFCLETNGNFDGEYALIDNLVIENYTGTKTLTVNADKEELNADENSVTFSFSDSVDASVLTEENITVTKNYEAYADYTLTDVTANSVTVSGLDDDGIYNVKFSDNLKSDIFGALAEKTYMISKGELSGFSYTQDFSEDISAWNAENIGKWVNNTAVGVAYDAEYKGADGAGGVMKIGNTSRPVFLFDKPVKDGVVRIGYNVKFDKSSANYAYYYSGLVDAAMIKGATLSDNLLTMNYGSGDLLDTFMAGGMETEDSAYLCPGVIGNNQPNVTQGITVDYEGWNRVDTVITIDSETNTYSALYYINGKLRNAAEDKTEFAAPFYAYVMYPFNMGTGNVYIDDIVIENYEGTKAFDVTLSNKDLDTDENSVTFTFTDNVDASALTKENITVTKNYEAYEGYTIENITGRSVTVSGLDDEGVYNITLSDEVKSELFGALEEKTYVVKKGKLSNFVYKQDFANSEETWNDANVGKWLNSKTTVFAHDANYIGPDGNAGVMKIADSARPVFVFNKQITDGVLHISYKIKADKSTAANAYYYSGLGNEAMIKGATVNNGLIEMNYSSANLVDTFMAGGMETDSNAFLCPGVIGSQSPNVGEGKTISFDEWNRVDVLIRIDRTTNTYFPVYCINGNEKMSVAGECSSLTDPFYAFVMYPFNMGTGNVYIDDVVIQHSYNYAVISQIDLSTQGKVKVTIPDAFSSNGTNKVVVAGYKEDALVGVNSADFTVGRAEVVKELDFDTADCDEIKVFLWDSLLNMTPVANAYVENID